MKSSKQSIIEIRVKFVNNYENLATSSERRVVLDLIEAALESIQPEPVLKKNFLLQDKILKIQGSSIELDNFKRIFLIGFGKGSAKISSIIEKTLGNLLTKGYVIDVTGEKFLKIDFTLGSHPLPSQINFDFTQSLLEKFRAIGNGDLVIVVTCGGGSALLEKPAALSLEEIIDVNKQLLKSGANIHKMNVVRKHLSEVKGGGLAKSLYPASVYNLIFSDVPSNDFSTIASGPLVLDKSTGDEAWEVIEQYNLDKKIPLIKEGLIETPKNNKYFEKVKHFLILNNSTALSAMDNKAKSIGKKVKIFTNILQGEARFAGKKLIENTDADSILLAAGETTVKVTGKGRGGRNMELVLGALDYIDDRTIISSFASDGWDNIEAAGAIGDKQTIKKIQKAGIDPKKYLDNNDSLSFFKAVGDDILTGRLPTNVSDLMIVLKK